VSNQMTNLCKWLDLAASEKSVLMCFADIADDKGNARPSHSWISIWTGLQRSAIIAAVRRLEVAGLIEVERTVGKTNRTNIVAESVASQIQSLWRTGPYAERVLAAVNKWSESQPGPVHHTDGTRSSHEPETSIQSNINKLKKKQPPSPPINKTAMPPEWTPSKELLEWAAIERPNLNLDHCVKAFRSYYLSTGDLRASWDEAFKSWVIRERSSAQIPRLEPSVARVAPDRDPALKKIEADDKRAVQPTEDQRAKLQAIRNQFAARTFQVSSS
jgi:hypothetical protein